MAPDVDAFSVFDGLLASADVDSNPWSGETYVPQLDLLRALLTIPIAAGERQESGRVAKAFDAWVAHELRRAGFPKDGVWPRTRRPRVLPSDLASLEDALEHLQRLVKAHEAVTGERLQPPSIRKAIRDLDGKLPGSSEAFILGDFYAKQIDVTVSSWKRGPEVIISTKTMFSSYRKNLKNRHEEAVGEVASLRARHPMAVMGYAYLVRQNIFNEDGAYQILVDILSRLRRPGQSFDATMLLVVDWDATASPIAVSGPDEPSGSLSSSDFFRDVIQIALERTPVSENVEVRRRREPTAVEGVSEEVYFDD